MNAFETWLLNQDRAAAIDHMVACLRDGGELAWHLMTKINGEKWSCKPEDMPAYINATLDKLAESPPDEGA